MAHTRSWIFPETIPADSDKVGKGDDEIRNIGDDITERAREGGLDWGNSTTTDGRHFAHVTGSTPGFKVYKSDKTTVALNFSDTAITGTAGIAFSGDNITSGNDPGHKHTGVVIIRQTGSLGTGRIRAIFKAPRPLDLVECRATVFAAPATASLRISGQRVLAASATDATNRLTYTGTALWLAAANQPTIIVGNFSDTTTVFDNGVTTMATNDEIFFEIDITGFTAAADLLIYLTVR